MWLSKNLKMPAVSADADMGITSIAGTNAGVVTRGETRALPVFSPGGYVWLPESGSTVLVIKGGPGGEESCLSGKKQENPPARMQPGEVYIHSAGGASVYLKNNGGVELQGDMKINGSLQINGQSCNAGVTIPTES